MTPKVFTAVFTVLYMLIVWVASYPSSVLDFGLCVIGVCGAIFFAYNLAHLILKYKTMMPSSVWGD